MPIRPELKLIRTRDLEASAPTGHWGVDSRFILRDVERLVFQHCEMDVGGGAESHTHHDQHQIFYVLEGQLRVTAGDGREVMVSPGEALLIPAGAAHATMNDGADSARYLVLTYRS
jgi:quercetin dioxygenase-like cupin family protein